MSGVHLALTLLFVRDATSVACTVCDTDVGIAVRSGLFNAAFTPTLLEVIAPFPVLALVIYAINRYLPE